MASVRNRVAVAALVAVFAVGTVSCGSSSGTSAGTNEPCKPNGKGDTVETLRVPQDHSTIQDAVCAAHQGDLVLVSKGIYREAVDVTTPNVTIRGTDRNTVILDGEFKLENGITIGPFTPAGAWWMCWRMIGRAPRVFCHEPGAL